MTFREFIEQSLAGFEERLSWASCSTRSGYLPPFVAELASVIQSARG
jgi:hypothetical protein